MVVALAAWPVDGQDEWPVDPVVIAAVILLNATLGLAQESKAANAIAALARMTAVTSPVLRDGELRRVPSAELVPGDLLLEEGNAVGADARLLRAAWLRVHEVSLTGESEAVLKGPPPTRGCGAHRGTGDMIFQGHGRGPGYGPCHHCRDGNANRAERKFSQVSIILTRWRLVGSGLSANAHELGYRTFSEPLLAPQTAASRHFSF